MCILEFQNEGTEKLKRSNIWREDGQELFNTVERHQTTNWSPSVISADYEETHTYNKSFVEDQRQKNLKKKYTKKATKRLWADNVAEIMA